MGMEQGGGMMGNETKREREKRDFQGGDAVERQHAGNERRLEGMNMKGGRGRHEEKGVER